MSAALGRAVLLFRAGLDDVHWVGGDSDTYMALSKRSVLAADFWIDARLPLYWLLIKALGQRVYEVAFA